jgi:osmotically-inducible protein OsmY
MAQDASAIVVIGKIIMINGVVTPRGPVHSLQEKGSIAATAQHIAGTNNVDNQLEIKGY